MNSTSISILIFDTLGMELFHTRASHPSLQAPPLSARLSHAPRSGFLPVFLGFPPPPRTDLDRGSVGPFSSILSPPRFVIATAHHPRRVSDRSSLSSPRAAGLPPSSPPRATFHPCLPYGDGGGRSSAPAEGGCEAGVSPGRREGRRRTSRSPAGGEKEGEKRWGSVGRKEEQVRQHLCH
jgi:hypothetical protein